MKLTKPLRVLPPAPGQETILHQLHIEQNQNFKLHWSKL